MILRRYILHFRRQDWIAIAMDCVIVVMGVFIGFQFNSLNEARIERDQVSVLMSRLEEDFRATEEDISEIVEEIDTLATGSGHLIDLLRSEETVPDVDDLRFYVNAPSLSIRLPLESATYLEMISSGSLSRIGDEQLRRALTRYGQNARDLELANERLLALQSLVTSGVDMMDAIRFDTNYRTPEGDGIIDYDWGLLREAEPQIQTIQIFQYLVVFAAEKQLEEVRTVLDLLEQQPH